jgi:hypothetical protein
MRQLYCFIFLTIITTIIIILFLLSKRNDFFISTNVNRQKSYFDSNQSIDNYARCILDMNRALNSLSIPWFITYGTALMYWRSKNFISDDIDTGVFYSDFEKRNYNESYFLSIMKEKFNFKSTFSYGPLDHGKEWTFSCPKSGINIDIFVFYSFNETNSSYAYWSASYNSLCNKMIYKKCRWRFSDFNLTSFEMYGKVFDIVPIEFIIEQYGKDYMIPKTYSYQESLKFLPNLIPEYNNR